MQDAFYAIYYTGQQGSGLGLLALKGGMVVGVDAVGGKFDGTYSVDTDKGVLSASIRMTVPANSFLVTGQPVRNQPYMVDLPIEVPLDLAGGAPIRLELPIGPLNIRFEKLRDFPQD